MNFGTLWGPSTKQQWLTGPPNAAKLERFLPPSLITRHAEFNALPENIGYTQTLLTLKNECMDVWVGEWMDCWMDGEMDGWMQQDLGLCDLFCLFPLKSMNYKSWLTFYFYVF